MLLNEIPKYFIINLYTNIMTATYNIMPDTSTSLQLTQHKDNKVRRTTALARGQHSKSLRDKKEIIWETKIKAPSRDGGYRIVGQTCGRLQSYYALWHRKTRWITDKRPLVYTCVTYRGFRKAGKEVDVTDVSVRYIEIVFYRNIYRTSIGSGTGKCTTWLGQQRD